MSDIGLAVLVCFVFGAMGLLLGTLLALWWALALGGLLMLGAFALPVAEHRADQEDIQRGRDRGR